MLSAILRRPAYLLIKDIYASPLHKSCTWNLLQNVNNGVNNSNAFRNQQPILQLLPCTNQIQQFSTSRQLMSSHSGDHSKLWTVEKFVSLALVGLLPATVLVPSQIIDVVTAVLLTLHLNWGLHHVTSDYIRKAVFGPTLPKIADILVYIISILTLAGLLNITFNDVGIGNTVKLIWSL